MGPPGCVPRLASIGRGCAAVNVQA